MASGFAGVPSDANAFAISAMSTVFRRGAISASMAMWARCSTARAPPTAPPLYPMKAAGLFRKAKLTNTLSIAFLSTAGMLWLYSGVMNTYASASAIFWFQRLTMGDE